MKTKRYTFKWYKKRDRRRAERRAIATEAFCTAARSYRSCYGELEDYLSAQVQACLTKENRQYVSSSGCSFHRRGRIFS